jgi:hypothetical protein
VAAVKTATKPKAAAKKAAPLPEWKTEDAEKLMKRRTAQFLAKHGTTDVVADLQALLTLSTKLTGYRRPCQLITAYKAPEPEPEEEEADEEEVSDEEEEETGDEAGDEDEEEE